MINIGYIILGIIVLFVPGFLLSFLIYPGEERFDLWERIASSIALSILVILLILTILAQPQLRALRFTPVIGSILAFCAVCGVIIYLRKESLQTLLTFFRTLTSEN